MTRTTLLSLLLLAPAALASVPDTLHYQGYLMDAAGAPVHCPDAEACDDIFNVTFRAYDVADGGEPLWEEVHPAVSVTHGLFNVALGSVTPLDPAVLGDPTWIGLEINAGGELLPRQRVVSAPFSLRAGQAESADSAALAEDADRLGGLDAVDYALVADLPGLCVTDDDLAALDYVNQFGVDEQIAAYLTAGGYVPGPHFSGDWSDLTGAPDTLGDDQDTLAGMSCEAGAIARFSGMAWTCSDDLVLTEDEVDAMVADNGYAQAEDIDAALGALAPVAASGDFGDLTGVPEALTDGDDDALAALACEDGQVAKRVGGAWACAPDAALTDAQVDAIVADNGYASEAALDGLSQSLSPVATGGAFGDLASVPDGLADGDDDALAALACEDGQVAKRVGGAWACAPDAALTDAQVDAIVADNGYASDEDLHSLAQSLSPVATGGAFGDLTGIPGGLADGDDDALEALGCADGEIARRVDGAWSCAPATTGQLPTSPPVACSGATVGTLFFDVSAGSLRICDGAEYRKIKICSEECPLPATVACGEAVTDDCGESCGEVGTGLNVTQCVAPELLACGATDQDDCGNTCQQAGTAPSADACPLATTVTCGQPVTDPCGNACGYAGTGCTGAGICLSGSCIVASSCEDILAASPSAESGTYTIDLDGPGGVDPMQASCDMETDGGGWTLALNYLHAGGTNPDLAVHNASLPLLGAESLGLDESASALNWGHASTSLLNAAGVDELMFYCRSSDHPRVIHFKNDHPSVIAYVTSGAGGMGGVYSGAHSTNLDLYSNATLPLFTNGENNGHANAGDMAVTEFPFYSDSGIGNPRAHWGIRGGGDRWECDDYTSTSGFAYSTLHRIWFR